MHLLHSQPRRVPRRPLRDWMVLRLLTIFFLNHLRTFIINMLHIWSLPICLTNSFIEIQDKKLRVSESQPKNRLFLGNIPSNLKEEDLTKFVSKQGPRFQHFELMKVQHLKFRIPNCIRIWSFLAEIRTVVLDFLVNSCLSMCVNIYFK